MYCMILTKYGSAYCADLHQQTTLAFITALFLPLKVCRYKEQRKQKRCLLVVLINVTSVFEFIEELCDCIL
ncbi:hypothetical protein EGR_09957 [Echinococcus granulosus]|uniref:Uncharacterized protein n=1 Tax=Echinococcus granulosus TaxID=6210 RepID=W6UP47_ECHGR|nr:hypothetical protein EGR_09957 [Echinococcus granulosus]EUB55194.1 hypothetical protein EGR_09957 [Echinococcus granulosus]